MTEQGSESAAQVETKLEPGKPIIQVDDLTVEYQNGFVAVAGISFDVKPGEILALIGSSGVGKTTILKTLNMLNHSSADGLAKVTSGRVLLSPRGIPVSLYEDEGVDPIVVRHLMGYVSQKGDLFPKTVWKNISYTPELLGVEEVTRVKLLKHFLLKTGANLLLNNRLVGKNIQFPELTDKMTPIIENALKLAALSGEISLEEAKRRNALSLSGGQQQRVAIARAIATGAKIIILDEPCASLDNKATEKVEDVLSDLAREGYTIVLNTHDMIAAKRIAHKVIHVDIPYSGAPGRIIDSGTPEYIFGDDCQPWTNQYTKGIHYPNEAKLDLARERGWIE